MYGYVIAGLFIVILAITASVFSGQLWLGNAIRDATIIIICIGGFVCAASNSLNSEKRLAIDRFIDWWGLIASPILMFTLIMGINAILLSVNISTNISISPEVFKSIYMAM